MYSEKNADDGQRNCPKHVEYHSKNKIEKLVHLVGFIIRRILDLHSCRIRWDDDRECWTTHQLTTSMEQRLPSEANSFSVKKYPSLYGTRRFINASISARNLSLSWARSIQSMPPSHFSGSFLIFSHLVFHKWSLSFMFANQNPVCTSPVPHTCNTPCPSLSFDLITLITFGENCHWLIFPLNGLRAQSR